MHRLILYIFLLPLTLSTYAQQGTFKGRFKSLSDGEEILYASITNKKGESRLTNSSGYVSITYGRKDTLIVSHLSYDTLFINPAEYNKGDTAVFYMKPKVYRLQEFTFSLLGPRHYFDNKFVKTDLGKSDIEKVKEQLNIEDMKDELFYLDRSAAGGVRLGSPITALYEQFSRAAKERRAYEELIRRDQQDSINREKYNPAIVAAITALDKEETEKFIEFCSFDPNYVESTEKVDIFFEILRCKQEYLMQLSE